MKIRFIQARLLAAGAAVALAAGLTAAATAGQAAVAASGSGGASISVFTLPLHRVGEVNLAALARSQSPRKAAAYRQGARLPRAAAAGSRYREVDNALLRRRLRGSAGKPAAAAVPLSTKNVPGEFGFSAMNGVQQADTRGGLDLEPPDQGLCVGGGYVMEFINNAIAIYDQNGDQLVRPVGSATAFKQPTSDFFSDPRCYYDASTQRWFYQEFIVGTVSSSGKVIVPSTEFEAVSNTSDPAGTYTIWSWNTTDAHTKGCPCFGDYDNLGADANGIYVATDEFAISPTGPYNGVIIYAIAKAELETVSQSGIVPPVVGYRITRDPFGQPEIVAPASTPPGGRFAPGTEYFVESNPDQFSDNHLVVYAMHDTSELTLFTSGPPKLSLTRVTTEKYAFPADATQKPGPRPLGAEYQAPPGGIQTDFDAEMEPTYTGGHLYAQLDTSTASGSDAVDWFILKPALSGSTLSASVVHQGVVAVKDASTMYPYTAVNSSGVGYLLFSLSGPHNYPSPAYIRYGSAGPSGPVILATRGAAPSDGFTCYDAFVGPNYGGCRWGDYSMGAVMNGRVFMAAEYIPPTYRDLLTNWGTYIWSAPAP